LKYLNYIILLLVVSVVLFVILILNYSRCNLSDSDAIVITKDFFNKMNVRYSQSQIVVNNDYARSSYQSNVKTVAFKVGEDSSITTQVDCDSKQVITFSNEKLITSTHQYMENVNGRQRSKLPLFIDENKAKEILLYLGKRLGLPQHVEFSEIALNKQAGIWTAKWKRKYNGIVCDDESVTITITAVSGEFCGFNNQVRSKIPQNEVKVSKAEAIEIARNKLIDHISNEKWEKNKDILVTKSADLKIITHRSILDRILSLDPTPRFVWVVVYDSKEGMDRNSIGILIENESVIQIDATNKKILSSEINIVP